MHKRTKELIEYGKRCGFEVTGLDGNGHYLLEHPNGERVRVAATPGDWRGDRNCQAEMRAKSGVTPPRPRAGRYRRGLPEKTHEPATERIDSQSRRIALLRKRHRELGELVEAGREIGDRAQVADALEELTEVEETFRELGKIPPPRRFRIY